jgi:hypothetical protein
VIWWMGVCERRSLGYWAARRTAVA